MLNKPLLVHTRSSTRRCYGASGLRLYELNQAAHIASRVRLIGAHATRSPRRYGHCQDKQVHGVTSLPVVCRFGSNSMRGKYRADSVSPSMHRLVVRDSIGDGDVNDRQLLHHDACRTNPRQPEGHWKRIELGMSVSGTRWLTFTTTAEDGLKQLRTIWPYGV